MLSALCRILKVNFSEYKVCVIYSHNYNTALEDPYAQCPPENKYHSSVSGSFVTVMHDSSERVVGCKDLCRVQCNKFITRGFQWSLLDTNSLLPAATCNAYLSKGAPCSPILYFLTSANSVSENDQGVLKTTITDNELCNPEILIG